MKRVLLAASMVAVLGSCTIGAPPGFSSGTSWSVPLVGPLEGGTLVVPVMVHDKGPYLFAIDLDSPVSQIDVALANELDLRTGIGPEFVDETDTLQVMKTAEVLRISIGTLTVRSRTFFASDVGIFNVSGRQIRGVIGRDILSESLVFGFDRDKGMAYIATQKGFTKPEGAFDVTYWKLKNRVPSPISPVSRRMVTARFGDKAVPMHVDLGDLESQLRPAIWDEAGLTKFALERELVDEVGTRRKIKEAGASSTVTLGNATATGTVFVPYADKRWDELDIGGSLGLGFFRDYNVWINLDDDVLHLQPRSGADQAKARIDRWGSATLSACATPACTTAELLEGDGEVEAATTLLHVSRTAEVQDLDLEVTLEPRGTDGAVGLQKLVAIFPAGTTDVTMPLDPAYAGAVFAVVDASPFVRPCTTNDAACVYALAEPR